MSECILWTGSLEPGRYGRITLSPDTRMYAHRVFYILYNGPIPDGFAIHHTCEDKRCVNPDHLTAVSGADHARLHPDVLRQAKEISDENRRRRTHCPHGHLFSGDNVIEYPKWRSRHCRVCRDIRNRARNRAKVAA